MTVPSERFRAIINAGQFLEDVAFGKYVPIAKHAKEVARMILRHYPTKLETEMIADKKDGLLDSKP